jgi:histidine triad (HIT) family protein
MNCIFCNIASGKTAAGIVYENDAMLAFLDHRPLFPGHTLLVPRQHFDTLTEVPAELFEQLSGTARMLALALEKGLQAQGTFVALNNRVSQSVPHLHIHVVPRSKGDGLRGFFWPRQKYRDAEHLEQVRQLVADAISDQLRASR